MNGECNSVTSVLSLHARLQWLAYMWVGVPGPEEPSRPRGGGLARGEIRWCFYSPFPQGMRPEAHQEAHPCPERGDNAGSPPHNVPESDLRCPSPRDKRLPRVSAERQPRPPAGWGHAAHLSQRRGVPRLRRSPHPRRGRAGAGAAPAPSLPARLPQPVGAERRHWRAPPPAAGRAAVHMACLMAAFSLGSALVRSALPSLRGAAASAGRGARCGAGGWRWRWRWSEGSAGSSRDASRGKSRVGGCVRGYVPPRGAG